MVWPLVIPHLNAVLVFFSVPYSIMSYSSPFQKMPFFSDDHDLSHKMWKTETVFVADESNLMLIIISVRHLVSTLHFAVGNVKVERRMPASSHSSSDKPADRRNKKHLRSFSMRPFVTLSPSLLLTVLRAKVHFWNTHERVIIGR